MNHRTHLIRMIESEGRCDGMCGKCPLNMMTTKGHSSCHSYQSLSMRKDAAMHAYEKLYGLDDLMWRLL